VGRQAGDLGPDVHEGERDVPEEDRRRNIGQEPLRSAKDEVHPARLAGTFTNCINLPRGRGLKGYFLWCTKHLQLEIRGELKIEFLQAKTRTG
jgi:hypothetical protein